MFIDLCLDKETSSIPSDMFLPVSLLTELWAAAVHRTAIAIEFQPSRKATARQAIAFTFHSL
jgi:hypothetical protein